MSETELQEHLRESESSERKEITTEKKKVSEEAEVKETKGNEESEVRIVTEVPEEIKEKVTEEIKENVTEEIKEKEDEVKTGAAGLEVPVVVTDQNGKEKEDEVDMPVEGEAEGDALDKVPDNILSEEVIKESISLLRRIGNGLAYSFIKLDLNHKQLTDISILEKYIHLRIINVSHNYLTDLKPFNSLTDLLQLTANGNRIASIMLDPCPYLQYISINNNRIKDICEGISHPLVRYIDLNDNKIEELPMFDGSRFLHLTTLKIEGNLIENISRFNIPNLKILHLGNNKITNTEWVLELLNLEELKLDKNFIVKTDGFHSNMTKLEYIDLRDNKIVNYTDMKQMSALPRLDQLILIDNPVSQNDDYRIEVLAVFLSTLKLLDEEEFSEDEVREAWDLAKRQQREIEIAKAEENSS